MEVVSAILGALGGVFNFLGADRQASAAENIAKTRQQIAQDWFDTLTQGWLSQERIAEIGAYFGRDVAQEEGDVQRTRIFYNYQSLATARGMIVALAGAGLLGLTVYLAAKEEA